MYVAKTSEHHLGTTNPKTIIQINNKKKYSHTRISKVISSKLRIKGPQRIRHKSFNFQSKRSANTQLKSKSSLSSSKSQEKQNK